MDCNESFKCAMFKAYPVGTLTIAAPLYASSGYLESGDVAVDEYADHEEVSVSNATLKVSSKQTSSLPGYAHTVTMDWDMDVTTEADVDLIETLRNTPHEIMFSAYGSSYLIRTDPDNYLLDASFKDGTTSCTMTLVNGQGLTIVKS